MDKEKEISIDSLDIKIGGREIKLSIAEAKKLKKALEELFGKEVIHEYHNGWYYRQYPYQYYTWGGITCNATVSSTTITNATNCLSLSIT